MPAGPSESSTPPRPADDHASLAWAALDAIPAHIAILDSTGQIVAVNRAWRAFAASNGLPAGAADAGANYLAACDRADGESAESARRFAAGVRAVLAGSIPQYAQEYDCHSPEGQRWFLGTVAPLLHGGRRHAFVAHQDISDRRAAAASLAHRTRALETVRTVGMELTRDLRLPLLLDRIIREAIGLIGGTWGVLWLWDPAAERLTPAAFIGHDPSWFPAIRLRLGEGVSGTVAQRRVGLIVPDVEASGLGAPALRGRRTPEMVMAEPLLYQDRLIGTIALDRWQSDPPFTAQDAELLQLFGAYAAIAIENARLFAAAQEELAARLAANIALRESRALLLTLTENFPDPIFVKDLEGRYLMVNAAICTLVGRPREAILGRDDRAIFPADVAAQVMARDRAVLAGGTSSSFEDTVPIQGIPRTFLEIKGPVVDAQGAVRGLFGIARDITEQRQEQARTLRAQQLESLGALASGIAHDMNNVLTPILMGVEEMKGQVTDEDGRSVLEMMETSARRGAQSLQQILSFARGAEVPRVPTRPTRIVDEVLAIARQTFPKSIQVYSDCCPSPWLFMGNASQLHQVLMNLCLNARDAMPEGGVLSIDAENVTLTDEEARRHLDARPGSYVALRIADSGTGIPLGDLDRIFDPFFTTKPQGRGTGLGLTTTLGIVQAHGGFISVDSTPGAGTTFSVFFPAIVESAPSEPATDAPQGHEGRGEWVLVVDDEAPICRVAASTLRRHGYRPLTAPSVQEALRLWREHRGQIAVVLTDLMMPFQDGFALMRALTAEDPGVRILAASGLATSEHVAQARSLGARAVLPKPYSADELLAALHHTLHTP
jgi:PAS domain S-box-containing protein